MPQSPHHWRCETSLRFTPPRKISPPYGEQNLSISLSNVVLPLPLLPTIAVVLPAGIVKHRLRKRFFLLVPPYSNDTFLNSMSERSPGCTVVDESSSSLIW